MTQFGGAGGSFGPNAWLVDDMYDRFLADPDSVSESWREFFADYRPAPVPAPQRPGRRPPPARRRQPALGDRRRPTLAAPAPAATGAAAERGRPVLLRGAASRIVANMEASLGVPTATSVRTVPARLLEVNRLILNNQLARTTGAKVSFTHIIGYAVVRALHDVPALNSDVRRRRRRDRQAGRRPPQARRARARRSTRRRATGAARCSCRASRTPTRSTSAPSCSPTRT